MIRFTYEGKEFEFRGEYRKVDKEDWFLAEDSGNVYRYAGDYTSNSLKYAIVHPVPVIHEFGDIKFVETGEVRTAKVEEWFMYRGSKNIYCLDHEPVGRAVILKRYEE